MYEFTYILTLIKYFSRENPCLFYTYPSFPYNPFVLYMLNIIMEIFHKKKKIVISETSLRQVVFFKVITFFQRSSCKCQCYPNKILIFRMALSMRIL